MDRETVLRSETGGFRKKSGDVRVCLVYPNTYEVGIANLGFQLVYRLFNNQEGVVCERAFMDTDPTCSLETRRRLTQFDIVAFSLSYEVDFLNILRTLRVAAIPVRATERKGLPLLFLGGVAAFSNPLPYSPFFDLLCVGEAEQVIPQLMYRFKKTSQPDGFLDDASSLTGVWVPSLGPKKTRRAIVSDLNEIETSSVFVSPLSHFKNMLLVEAERGCSFNCRFCLASQAYSPCRFKDSRRIVQEVSESRLRSESIGLIGAAISEVPGLSDLITQLSGLTKTVGISSLRLDRVDEQLLQTLVTSGLKTVTIAPEAGSERLRSILNKRITDDEILHLASLADLLRIGRMKLYFMIGLPFEKDEDLRDLVELVQRLRKTYRGELVVSINPFVPKPHTPFQYHEMEEKKSLARKSTALAKELRQIGHLKLITKSAREATLQALISLGDQSVGAALLRMVDDRVGWEMAFRTARLDADRYLKAKPVDSMLPWDFIDFGVDAGKLAESYCEAERLSRQDAIS